MIEWIKPPVAIVKDTKKKPVAKLGAKGAVAAKKK